MRLGILALLCIVLVTSGCAAAAISSGTYAVKAMKRDDLLPLAEAGDVQAQYQLGKSWCCMGPGFDTQTATEWLCAAAAQQHPEALYELGRIYDGAVSRTPAPGQKLLRLATAKRSPAHALAFYQRAASLGNTDAATQQQELEHQLSAATLQHAAALASNLEDACTYEQVFARTPTTE